jgi:hypothetical protein
MAKKATKQAAAAKAPVKKRAAKNAAKPAASKKAAPPTPAKFDQSGAPWWKKFWPTQPTEGKH